MKRMVNNVPLCTVMGLLGGFTKVVIEDRTERHRWCDNAEDTVRWEGYAKDFYSYKLTADINKPKWDMTKVCEIRHLPDSIMIVISTQFEEY